MDFGRSYEYSRPEAVELPEPSEIPEVSIVASDPETDDRPRWHDYLSDVPNEIGSDAVTADNDYRDAEDDLPHEPFASEEAAERQGAGPAGEVAAVGVADAPDESVPPGVRESETLRGPGEETPAPSGRREEEGAVVAAREAALDAEREPVPDGAERIVEWREAAPDAEPVPDGIERILAQREPALAAEWEPVPDETERIVERWEPALAAQGEPVPDGAERSVERWEPALAAEWEPVPDGAERIVEQREAALDAEREPVPYGTAPTFERREVALDAEREPVPDGAERIVGQREAPAPAPPESRETRDQPEQAPRYLADRALAQARDRASEAFELADYLRMAIEDRIREVSRLIDRVAGAVGDRPDLIEELDHLDLNDPSGCLDALAIVLAEALGQPVAVRVDNFADWVRALSELADEAGSPREVTMAPGVDGKVDGRAGGSPAESVEVRDSAGVTVGAHNQIDVTHVCEVERPVIEIADLIAIGPDGPVFDWSAWGAHPARRQRHGLGFARRRSLDQHLELPRDHDWRPQQHAPDVHVHGGVLSGQSWCALAGRPGSRGPDRLRR
ncbi:hypothetical protein DFJ67_1915 [Asanoa ferruginea]|uniref:Uncharacterized protein n=1 Tax=Asanoa ferruginea TaxID=53367 RepID=A0A3D9ZF73_9ACTN|nr:hypothetical protein [Asanoa ferruginea]REF95951.1 hypothetical protein DFJ67_1915 [Asanoa ferruginea]